jgi:hypothetical protein
VHARVALKLLAPLVLVVAVVLPLASAGASPPASLTRVSQDRLIDTIGFHQMEVQPSLASAVGSKTLVSAFEVGRAYNGGASAIGWATSTNGGKSWKHGLVPLTIQAGGPSSTYRGADPSVAYNARYGKWLLAATGLGSTANTLGLYVSRSSDGKSWSAPITAHAAGTGDTPTLSRIACDNSASSAGYGNCYLAYSNSAANNTLQVIGSTDDGASWSAPVGSPTNDTSSTTLAAASAVGATNIKVASVLNISVGQTLVVDSGGANPETVSVTSVGTAGGGGTGVGVTPALAFAHANGATVTENNVQAQGTGATPVVTPAHPSTSCGRVVVSYANGATLNDIASSDCGSSFGLHAVVASTLAAQHTVAQGLRVSLFPSAAMDKAGAIYLAYQTRAFRITQTTLAAAANAGDTNIKVGSVTGMVAGNTLTVDTGAAAETVSITTVGTAGSGGTGVTITPALASAHAAGAFVTVNGVPSTSTAAPNDVALAVMPAPTDAAPTPSFGTPSRVALESDAGASSNTVDHFIPAIAADANTSGGSAHLALFYYFYPLSACQYVQDLGSALNCHPSVGYASSTNGGSTWSSPQTLATMGGLAVTPRTGPIGVTNNGNPDLGAYTSAAIIPAGPLAGKATSIFDFGDTVNGFDISMYTPTHGLTVGGGS